MDWAVAVFAHNEASTIVDCLRSILRQTAGRRTQVQVLANGCTDETADVVNAFALEHPEVRPIVITRGDKCNAWNVFVHETSPRAEIYFYVDGDVQVCANAFDALARTLVDAPSVNAAAAVPDSGRSRAQLTEMTCRGRLLHGNLYALPRHFVDRIRQRGVRLPAGYIGDDGLVTSLAKWDLNPEGPFIHDRIAPCPEARFWYRSLSPLRLDDWRLYLRRRVRYSVRHFQHELLAPQLRAQGITGMPGSANELLCHRDRLSAFRRRPGLEGLFDLVALRQMRLAASVLSQP
jgi:glycosyltransferase involved in cell wall biosynthesis